LPHGSLFGAPAVCSNGKAAMEWLEYVGTFWVQELLPSGNLTIFNSLLLKMAIEIVDFPMKNGDFP